MTTEAWLGILSAAVFAVLGVAVVWGGMKNEIGNQRTEIGGIKVSRDKQGERTGAIERTVDRLEGRIAAVEARLALGRPTHARGVPLPPIDFDREREEE